MQKEIDNLEFVQGVHFEFINSLKNKGTKYLLIFDESCAEICISEEILDIATAGRYRGISTIYIKHNLFRQSKLGRDVELQNTLIVLFKSPRDVHQVPTVSVQLGLGSTIVDWYRDATSVPFGFFAEWFVSANRRSLTLLHNEWKNSIKNFMYPTTWSIWIIWTMKTLNLSTLQAFQHISFACKIQFVKTCPKEFIRLLSDYIVNLLQGNLSEVKRSQVLKYRDEIHELFLKWTTWKQRRSPLSSQKWLLLIKTISPFVINHLLEMDQFVLIPLSVYNSSNNPTNITKKTTQKQTWGISHVPQRYVKKGN